MPRLVRTPSHFWAPNSLNLNVFQTCRHRYCTPRNTCHGDRNACFPHLDSCLGGRNACQRALTAVQIARNACTGQRNACMIDRNTCFLTRNTCRCDRNGCRIVRNTCQEHREFGPRDRFRCPLALEFCHRGARGGTIAPERRVPGVTMPCADIFRRRGTEAGQLCRLFSRAPSLLTQRRPAPAFAAELVENLVAAVRL